MLELKGSGLCKKIEGLEKRRAITDLACSHSKTESSPKEKICNPIFSLEILENGCVLKYRRDNMILSWSGMWSYFVDSRSIVLW